MVVADARVMANPFIKDAAMFVMAKVIITRVLTLGQMSKLFKGVVISVAAQPPTRIRGDMSAREIFELLGLPVWGVLCFWFGIFIGRRL